MSLLRLAPEEHREEHRLLVSMHHIASDGWSVDVFLAELAALYARHAHDERAPAGVPAPLPELPVQYADFAVWQRGWLAGERLEAELGFWRRELAGLEPLDLPADRPRPPEPSGRGGVVAAIVAPERARTLAALGRSEGATLFMVLLAAFQALLGRLAGRDDLAVGVPVAGRRWREVEGLIGFFVNTLPLRADLGGGTSGRDLLGRTRQRMLAAFAHQDVPFELLVEHLEPERDSGRPPLVQVLFGFHPEPVPPELPGLRAEAFGVETGTARVDLSLSVAERADGALALSLEHSLDLFDRSTARRLLTRFERLAAALAESPGSPVAALPLLSAVERAQLVAWNDTAAGGAKRPREGTLLDLFAAHARRAPEAPAVSGGGRVLSYGALDALSDRLAARLLDGGGLAGPGDEVVEPVIALRLGRSPELVVALLAVVKAGAAFLPLDPESPGERQRAMVEDARAVRVLEPGDVELDALAGLSDVEGKHSTSRPEPARSPGRRVPFPEQLAYVIFTSGSTGRPKGVALTHAGLLNLVLWHRRAFGLAPGDRVPQLAGLGFDAAVWEVAATLGAGAALHLPPDEARWSPELLRDWLVEERITVGFLPTPLAERVLALDWPAGAGPRLLLTGGDRLRPLPALPRPFAVINNYGPTEGTVVATSGRVEPGDGAPSIGRPIEGARVHVLDRALRPVPPGTPGELCLAGVGLARGYLFGPSATAAVFVPDPSSRARGERLYRTGDRVRWRTDGRLEFLGRLDAQVKVRGFRVEPGEAEAALARQPGVRECAVLALDDGAGGKRLVAFVVQQEAEAIEPGSLRHALRAVLPEFLVPSAFVSVAELPLTANGKLDRRALARLAPPPGARGGSGDSGDGRTGPAPRTPTEEILAAVWSDLLGGGRPGPEDDFFSLGGHSLLAARLAARVGELFGVELPIRAVFDAPVLADLAARIDGGTRSAAEPIPRTTGDEAPASFAQQRLWFLQQLRPDGVAYSMPMAARARGRLDARALAAALGEVIRRHEPLRTSFAADGNGSPVQRIAPWAEGRPAPLPRIDLLALPRERAEAEADRLARQDAHRPFDLARGPLARFSLVRIAEGDTEAEPGTGKAAEHLLLAVFHHTVADGWSFSVFGRELAAAYRAFLDGATPALAPLPVRYADFAAWQRRLLEEGVLDEQLAWWRERLAGDLPVLDLPGDPAPSASVTGEARAGRRLGPDLTDGLRALARRHGATLFMVLLAALQVLLHRLSGDREVVVGTPVAGRPRPELEGLIGLFLNALALRGDVSGDPSFEQLLARVRALCLGAYAHQELPFERLVEALQPERDPGRHPLFDVMLNMINVPREELRLPELTLSWRAPVEPEAKLPLTLFATEQDGGLELEALADPRRFGSGDAARWLEQLEALLAQAVAEPAAPISSWSLVTAVCRSVLPDPAAPLPDLRYAPVTDLLAAEARRHPERAALVQGDVVLSYGALVGAAAAVARGIPPGRGGRRPRRAEPRADRRRRRRPGGRRRPAAARPGSARRAPPPAGGAGGGAPVPLGRRRRGGAAGRLGPGADSAAGRRRWRSHDAGPRRRPAVARCGGPGLRLLHLREHGGAEGGARRPGRPRPLRRLGERALRPRCRRPLCPDRRPGGRRHSPGGVRRPDRGRHPLPAGGGRRDGPGAPDRLVRAGAGDAAPRGADARPCLARRGDGGRRPRRAPLARPGRRAAAGRAGGRLAPPRPGGRGGEPLRLDREQPRQGILRRARVGAPGEPAGGPSPAGDPAAGPGRSGRPLRGGRAGRDRSQDAVSQPRLPRPSRRDRRALRAVVRGGRFGGRAGAADRGRRALPPRRCPRGAGASGPPGEDPRRPGRARGGGGGPRHPRGGRRVRRPRQAGSRGGSPAGRLRGRPRPGQPGADLRPARPRRAAPAGGGGPRCRGLPRPAAADTDRQARPGIAAPAGGGAGGGRRGRGPPHSGRGAGGRDLGLGARPRDGGHPRQLLRPRRPLAPGDAGRGQDARGVRRRPAARHAVRDAHRRRSRRGGRRLAGASGECGWGAGGRPARRRPVDGRRAAPVVRPGADLARRPARAGRSLQPAAGPSPPRAPRSPGPGPLVRRRARPPRGAPRPVSGGGRDTGPADRAGEGAAAAIDRPRVVARAGRRGRASGGSPTPRRDAPSTWLAGRSTG